MEIQHKDNGEKGQFYIEQGDRIIAKLTYVWDSNQIVINHTEVDGILKGKGVGKQLIQKTVEFARTKGVKISPVCSFAMEVLNKTDEYKDILA